MTATTKTDYLTWTLCKIIGEQAEVEPKDEAWEVIEFQKPSAKLNVRTLALRLEEEIEKHNLREELRLKEPTKMQSSRSPGVRILFLIMVWLILANLIAETIVAGYRWWAY